MSEPGVGGTSRWRPPAEGGPPGRPATISDHKRLGGCNPELFSTSILPGRTIWRHEERFSRRPSLGPLDFAGISVAAGSATARTGRPTTARAEPTILESSLVRRAATWVGASFMYTAFERGSPPVERRAQ